MLLEYKLSLTMIIFAANIPTVILQPIINQTKNSKNGTISKKD